MRLAGSALSEGVYLFFAAPWTTMGAQFMYISRFPILLNHDNASVYRPGAKPAGILNWKVLAPLPLGSAGRFPSVFAGHPPSMEWITFHTVALLGRKSLVRLIWHDPPPWTALPVKLSV